MRCWVALLVLVACSKPARPAEEPVPANESAPAETLPGRCGQLRGVIEELVNDSPPGTQIAGVGTCAIEAPVYRCRALHPTWASAAPAFDGLLREIEPCLTGHEWASEQLTTSDASMWWRFETVNDAVKVRLVVHTTEDGAVELVLDVGREP